MKRLGIFIMHFLLSSILVCLCAAIEKEEHVHNLDSEPLESFGDVSVKTLNIGKEILNEKLHMDSQKLYYTFEEVLLANAAYEIKISYLSTTPADFHMSLLGVGEDKYVLHGRDLLNTERIVVHTDSDGNVVHESLSMLLQVSAISTGIRPPFVRYTLDMENQKLADNADERSVKHDKVVHFNIIMEPLLLGILPHGALRMVIWGLFLVFIAFRMVPWFLRALSFTPTEKES